MKKDVKKLRIQYMNNLPLGYSKNDISRMSDEELLDMDYFLNEDINDIFEIPNSPTTNNVLAAVLF